MSNVKVKNTSPKVIGMGDLRVVQGDTVELPIGFGVDHPTIKWLLNRGWLTKVSASGIHLPPGAGADTPPANTGGDGDTHDDGGDPLGGNSDDDTDDNGELDTNDDTDTGNAANAPAGELSRRTVERMNLTDLRELATQRGLPFEQNANRAALIELITASMAFDTTGGQE